MLSARILTAAREAFAETGWAGTTMRAVARGADVDPALVYHYFGSKEGLLDAASNRRSAGWRTSRDLGDTGEELGARCCD